MEATVTTLEAPTRSWTIGALIGLVSGAVAIGVSQLASGLFGAGSSPVLAVGGSAIDATPEWLKAFAIRTFGAGDKTVLLTGIGLTLIVAAVALGIVSMRRPRAGTYGLVALGAIGALAAITRPANALVAAVPALVGMTAGLADLSMAAAPCGLGGPGHDAR